MKKMKRALSLVLTMVMLLGMVMIPTGAVGNFADAERIENKEAVTITSGIGLFAGTADGNFAPKASVTRAQMATIIVKMLRGNEFNADAFKGVGVNPFPDTASFEGGWAEGYINACSQLGVVAGYGDGTFKPGRELTTAEAITMIINALGVDPGPGEWPTNYMAKAEAMKLYGDLAKKPGTNEPLNREQLAVIVWEGMKYSPAGNNGYSVSVDGKTFTFDNITDAIKAAGGIAGVTEVIGDDSLASKVYEIKSASGWITGNVASGEACTVLTRATGDEEYYDVESGVNMLGHYVTVYYQEQYKNEENPGKTYTIVDESTVVTVNEDITTAKKYKEAFGKSMNLAETGFTLDGTYASNAVLSVVGYTAGSAAPKGTYIIADGMIVTYIAPTAVYASYVFDIDTAVGNETVWLNGANGDRPIPNAKDDDQLVEYDGMKIGDFVTYIKVQDSFVVSPVAKVAGTVTKTATTELDGETYETITINGTTYLAFEPKDTNPSRNNASGKLDTRLSNVNYGQNYTLYVTEDERYIGFESAGATISMDNTVFLLGTLPAPVKEKDQYGKVAFVNKVRGIDMDGNEVMLVIGKALDVNGDGIYAIGEDAEALGSMDPVQTGYYTYELSTDKDEKKEEIQVLTAYAGGYGPQNPTYAIMAKDTSGTFTGSGSISTSEGIPAYGTSRMKFFAVDGSVTDSAPLTVSRPSGVKIQTKSNKYYVLVTRVANGSTEIEAFVYLSDEKMGQTVYFRATQEQIETGFRTVDGQAYTVYSADSGKEIEIVLDPQSNADLTVPGMYYGKKDGDGLFYEIKPVTTESPIRPTFSDNAPQVASDVGFWGVTNNYLRGERMASSAGGAINMMMNGWTNNASSAAVVDLRSEEEIEASGVPAITTLNQMVQLKENDPGLIIVYDAYLTDNSNGSQGVVETVFVTAAYRRTVGLNSIVYASASPSSGDMMIAARTPTADVGEKVKVNFDVTEAAGPGFYRFGVIAGGKLALLPFDADVVPSGLYGNHGMTAMHNTVDRIEILGAGTLRLITSDAHNNCAFKCADSALEALKDINVTKDTLVWDAVAEAWISPAALNSMWNTNDLVISYYCDFPAYNSSDSANKDTTAELVIVESKSAIESSCDGDHSAMIPVTGNSITESGSYYLTGDMTQTLNIAAVDVTVCMNGYSIRIPTTTSGSAVVVADGGHVELVTCQTRSANSALVGVNASAVIGGYTIDPVDSNRIVLSSMAYCAQHGWHDDGTWQPLTGTTLTSGKYYLAGDTVASGAITVSGNVTLCLGNSTLSAPATNVTNFIVVGSGVTLTIVADENGAIQGNSAVTGTRGIQVKGTLNLKSGTITGFKNNSAYGGAGVCVDVGTFVMEGGTITGNETANSTASFLGGAGVTVTNGGKFTMKGGTISENYANVTHGSAAGGGGGVSASGGTFTMEGGTVENNTAYVQNGNYGGGGVHVADVTSGSTTYQGTFAMNGGTIRNNTAAIDKSAGGGVSITKGGVFIMAGGTITGNQAKQGGGIQGYGDATVTINGGTISNNEARNTTNGGGAISMLNPGASLVINGGTITGNVAKNGDAQQNYGAIFAGGDVPVEINGGNIYGNVSKTNGIRINGANSGKNSKITGGTIREKISVNKPAMCDITGGTFVQDPSALGTIPSTHAVTDNGDGTFTVTQKETDLF